MGKQRTVEVLIKAKDQTKKGIESSGNQFKRLSNRIIESEIAMTALAAAVATGAAHIVRSFQQATQNAIEFQAAVAEVNTLLSADADSVAKMSDELQNLAVRYGQVDTVMAKAQYNVVSAGFDGITESLEILDVASKAAIGGISDVNTASLLITQTLNAYSKGAEEASHVSDLLFQTVKDGVINFTQLAGGLGKVTNTAAAAGIELEEVLATIAVMTKKGIVPEEAFTALNALIISIGAATGEQKDKLEELGITLDQGLAPALVAVSEAGGETLDVLAELIPEKRALKAAAAAGADGAKLLNIELERMDVATGAATEAHREMAQTVKQLTAVAVAQAKKTSEAMGRNGLAGEVAYLTRKIEELKEREDDLKRFGDGSSELAENWGKLKGHAEGFFTVLTRGALVAGHLVGKIDELNQGYLSFLTGGKKAEESQDAFNGSLIMTSDGLIDMSEKLKAAESDAQRYSRQAQEAADKQEAMRAAIAATAAELAAADLRSQLEQIAAGFNVPTTQTIFDLESMSFIDVPIASDIIAEELTEAAAEAAAKAAPQVASELERMAALTQEGLVAMAEKLGVATHEAVWQPIFQQMIDVPRSAAALQADVEAAWREAYQNADLIGPVQEGTQGVDDLSASLDAAATAAQGLGRGVGTLVVDAPFKVMTGQAVDFAKVMQTTVMSVLQAVLKQLLVIRAIGFFGNALGLSGGGQVPALATGGSIPKAAYGYSVPDGVRGKDSRLIMAMPGEEVINRQLSQRLDRFIRAQESAAYASPYGSGVSGGGGNTVIIHQEGIPDSMAGRQRMKEDIVESLSEGGTV